MGEGEVGEEREGGRVGGWLREMVKRWRGEEVGKGAGSE